MIGFLRGTLVSADEESVVIDCNGVGFEFTPTASVLGQLPAVGQSAQAWIHTVVREDDISLFGFVSPEERKVFRILTTVSGVGPKVAMTLISGLGHEGLVQAVATGNPLPLTRVKGIGKRIAERVTLELKDRITEAWTTASMPVPAMSKSPQAINDAFEALLNLGFKRNDIMDSIKNIKGLEKATAEEIVRNVLQRLKS